MKTSHSFFSPERLISYQTKYEQIYKLTGVTVAYGFYSWKSGRYAIANRFSPSVQPTHTSAASAYLTTTGENCITMPNGTVTKNSVNSYYIQANPQPAHATTNTSRQENTSCVTAEIRNIFREVSTWRKTWIATTNIIRHQHTSSLIISQTSGTFARTGTRGNSRNLTSNPLRRRRQHTARSITSHLGATIISYYHDTIAVPYSINVLLLITDLVLATSSRAS